MSDDLSERARWLARNVLPHEALIRARVRDISVFGLDIEDVIQETYTRILSVAALESIRHPKQYAVQTARAIVIDHARHSRVVSIAFTGSLESLALPVDEASAEERLEFQGEVAAVADALAQLPDRCREILILRRIEGLSQKEVAKRLNTSEKSVERHMTEAVRQLVKIFGRGGKSRKQTSHSVQENGDEDVLNQPGS
jgi:RNA polymerase sigma-70 factor (ECF subfamily)